MKKVKSQSLYFEMGNRIQYARRAVGYTQEQLAEAIDVSAQYISNLECGKVGMSITTFSELCKILGVSSDYILFGEDIPSHEIEYALQTQKQMKRLSGKERKLIETIVTVLTRFFLK